MQSLLTFSVDQWNDQCDTMHRVDDEDAKKIVKEMAIKRVGELYAKKEIIENEYTYLFKEGVDSLCSRSTKYLIKWIATVRMSGCVLERGKTNL